jgi:hypothetical protein
VHLGDLGTHFSYCDIIFPLLCVYPRGNVYRSSKSHFPTVFYLIVIFPHSVSTLEDVSFVSAEESVADLRDFDELRQEENSFQTPKLKKGTKIRGRSSVLRRYFQCHRGTHMYENALLVLLFLL